MICVLGRARVDPIKNLESAGRIDGRIRSLQTGSAH
jgi:hypothetical protein